MEPWRLRLTTINSKVCNEITSIKRRLLRVFDGVSGRVGRLCVASSTLSNPVSLQYEGRERGENTKQCSKCGNRMDGPQDEEICLSVQISEQTKQLSQMIATREEDEYVELECSTCHCSRKLRNL